MSDYMFMLESHLSPDQNRVVAQVQSAASAAGVSLFLAGGAMRDMLGGFQVRDLDFTVEGNALKLRKALEASGARVVAEDTQRKSIELVFPGGVTAEVSMARSEHYARLGSRPQVAPTTIQEDLRRRDFTVNAIALSLNRASRGLLIDPLNGLAEIGRRELRAVYATALYDDPTRLLRLIRLRSRLGYEIEEKTRSQYQNAREAGVDRMISRRVLGDELIRIAAEPTPSEVIRSLDHEGLLALFSPELAGPKLNLAGLSRLEKAKRLIPPDAGLTHVDWAPFLHVLMETLPSKERAVLVRRVELRKSELSPALKLPSNAKKLETALKSPRIKKPSQLHALLSHAGGAEIVFLLYQSSVRLVHDRLKNYLQKYLPMAQEVTDAQVEAAGAKPGTAKFRKVREALITARLDGRPKKPPPVELPPPPGEPPRRGRPPGR